MQDLRATDLVRLLEADDIASLFQVCRVVQYGGNSRPSGRVNWFLAPRDGGPTRFMIRAIRSPAFAESLTNEVSVLRKVREIGKELVPEILWSGTLSGTPAFAQSYLGTAGPLSPRWWGRSGSRRRQEELRSAALWLLDLWAANGRRCLAPQSPLAQECLRLPDLYGTVFGQTPYGDGAVLARLATDAEGVCASALPVGVVHGDYWHRNFLREADGRICVVDWEWARMEGLIHFDLAFLALDLLEPGAGAELVRWARGARNTMAGLLLRETDCLLLARGLLPVDWTRFLPLALAFFAIRDALVDGAPSRNGERFAGMLRSLVLAG